MGGCLRSLIGYKSCTFCIPFLFLGILSSAIRMYYNEGCRWPEVMTVSYSINGKSVTAEELKEVQITKKDYIDYVEAIRQSAGNYYREQGGEMPACETGKVQSIG